MDAMRVMAYGRRWSLAAAMAIVGGVPVVGVRAPGAQVARTREPTRDSTAREGMRVRMLGDSIEILISRLLQSKQLEAAVAMSLREATGDGADARRDTLRARLTRIARDNFGLISRIQLQCVSEDPMPEGWLGVYFVETRVTKHNDEPAVLELGDRPTVLSVEPGSPAAKAGIQAGDLLLKIGGHDARGIALAPILRPGVRVTVSLQRDNTPREVTGVVDDHRPSGFGSDCKVAERMVGPDGDPIMIMRTPGYGRMPAVAFARVPGPAPDAPAPPPAGPGGVLGYVFTPNGAASFIAIAERIHMMALDDDWKQQMGVDNGVLVMKVASGSPASDAGLKGRGHHFVGGQADR